MPVTDGAVTLGQQDIGRDVVVLDVVFDLLEGPVGEGVDLDHASVVDLDDIHLTTLATLRLSASGDDGSYLELGVGSLGGLDLGNVVVELLIVLPKLLTMLGGELVDSLATLWLVDVDCLVGISSLDTVDKLKCLLEVVQGVQEDEVNVRLDGSVEFREHVIDGESSQAKGSGLVETRQRCDAPFEDI